MHTLPVRTQFFKLYCGDLVLLQGIADVAARHKLRLVHLRCIQSHGYCTDDDEQNHFGLLGDPQDIDDFLAAIPGELYAKVEHFKAEAEYLAGPNGGQA
jgi:hypothetical protein